MPYSSMEGKGFFKDWLYYFMLECGIIKILDIGAGAGWYGKACREVFQILESLDDKFSEKYKNTLFHQNRKNFMIEGVEVFSNYIEKFHLQSIYRKVYCQNILDWVNTNKLQYDLCILGDVLEHLSYENAIFLFNELKKQSKFIWLSLPIKPFNNWTKGYNQKEDEWKNNSYEQHLYYWEFQEIIDVLGPFLFIAPYPTVSCFIAEGVK